MGHLFPIRVRNIFMVQDAVEWNWNSVRDEDFYAWKMYLMVWWVSWTIILTQSWRRCFVQYTSWIWSQYEEALSGALSSAWQLWGWNGLGQSVKRIWYWITIVAKKAVPMLIVMDNGYATRPSEQTPFQTTVFEEVLMQEVIPILMKFRTLLESWRLLPVYQWGANQTMRIAMNYPEAFAYYGGFSGTSNYPSSGTLDADTFLGGKFKDGKAVNRHPSLSGLGTSWAGSFSRCCKAFRQMLDKQGIKYTYYESPETAHGVLTWRRALHQYVQCYFNKN